MSAALTANETPPTEQPEEPYWSKLAIVTFALSLLSPLALLSPVFWSVAFVLIASGVAAIVLVARGRGVVRGGILACIATVLCLFFVSFAISRYAASDHYKREQARGVAEHWFALIKEGKLNEAHQMVLGSEKREMPEIPLDAAYQLNAQLASDRDSFFLQPPIKHLVSDPKNCTVQFVNFAGRNEVDEKAESLKLRFRIRYIENEVTREVSFTLAVGRYFHPRFEDHRWVIRGLASIETK